VTTGGYQEEDFAFQRLLGIRIRERRLAMGMKNPADLARAINDPRISADYIGSIERAASGVRFTALIRIASGLGTTTAHLLGDAEAEVRDADEDAIYRRAYDTCLDDVRDMLGKLARTNNGHRVPVAIH
jgi:transcriptional regulator with XRE-family HTH domain